MKPKVVTEVRKMPKQARSRQMVETILDATARILVERGYAGATTNSVAERAGVSVGSLYQYFPTLEALIAAVAQRHSAQVKSSLEAEMARSEGLDLRNTVSSLLDAVVAVHALDPRLNRVLAEEVPRLGPLDWRIETMDRGVAVVRRVLASHKSEIRADLNLDHAACLIVTLVEGALHSAAREPSRALPTDALISELVELVHRYVRSGDTG